MIVDRLENLGRYAGLGENLAAAARWLAATDREKTEAGAGRVAGDRV